MSHDVLVIHADVNSSSSYYPSAFFLLNETLSEKHSIFKQFMSSCLSIKCLTTVLLTIFHNARRSRRVKVTCKHVQTSCRLRIFMKTKTRLLGFRDSAVGVCENPSTPLGDTEGAFCASSHFSSPWVYLILWVFFVTAWRGSSSVGTWTTWKLHG